MPAGNAPMGQRWVLPADSGHRSASRAQGAANETSVEHHETAPVAASGHTHEAKAPEPAKKDVPAKAPANEPIILGVGVPASEL